MKDINPPVEVKEITPQGNAVLDPPLKKKSRITRSGLFLSKRKIITIIHWLILPTVLMIRATNVEEVGIGLALVVQRRKW